MTDYKVKKGLIIDKLGDKTKILDGEKSLFYSFNDTATFVFEKLKQGINEKEIVNALVKTFSVKRDRAEIDLKEFISDLIKKRIIQKA